MGYFISTREFTPDHLCAGYALGADFGQRREKMHPYVLPIHDTTLLTLSRYGRMMIEQLAPIYRSPRRDLHRHDARGAAAKASFYFILILFEPRVRRFLPLLEYSAR